MMCRLLVSHGLSHVHRQSRRYWALSDRQVRVYGYYYLGMRVGNRWSA